MTDEASSENCRVHLDTDLPGMAQEITHELEMHLNKIVPFDEETAKELKMMQSRMERLLKLSCVDMFVSSGHQGI